jgi:hypothetical protein
MFSSFLDIPSDEIERRESNQLIKLPDTTKIAQQLIYAIGAGGNLVLLIDDYIFKKRNRSVKRTFWICEQKVIGR